MPPSTEQIARSNVIERHRRAFAAEVEAEIVRIERARQAAREGDAILAGTKRHRENEQAEAKAEAERGRLRAAAEV